MSWTLPLESMNTAWTLKTNTSMTLPALSLIASDQAGGRGSSLLVVGIIGQ